MDTKNIYEDNQETVGKHKSFFNKGPVIKDIQLKDLQSCELRLLKSFISVCEENDLQYYLAGGTLLGAVRNGGFIPWDDDIDVIMPRKDYDRFNEIASVSNTYYEIENCHTDAGFTELFTKYMDVNTTAIYKNVTGLRHKFGVWIDIFPFDTASRSILSNKLFILQDRIYNICISHKLSKISSLYRSANPVKRIGKCIISRIVSGNSSVNDVVLRKEKLYKSFSNKNTGYVCNYAGRRILLSESVFDKGITMEFEGISVVVPEQYDVWLEKLYGPDYMENPPIEKQVIKHENEFDILDLEHSYRIYVDEKGQLL